MNVNCSLHITQLTLLIFKISIFFIVEYRSSVWFSKLSFIAFSFSQKYTKHIDVLIVAYKS